VCNAISGSGAFNAISNDNSNSYDGSPGRIRIETNSTGNWNPGTSTPAPFIGTPGTNPQLMRDTATPSVRITTVGGYQMPDDPQAKMTAPEHTDQWMPVAGSYPVVIETTNVPSTWVVKVRVVYVTPGYNGESWITASFVGESGGVSTWTANVQIYNGIAAIQARANAPDYVP